MITGSGDYLPIEGKTPLTNARRLSVRRFFISMPAKQKRSKSLDYWVVKLDIVVERVPNQQLTGVPFHSDRDGRSLGRTHPLSVLAPGKANFGRE